MLNSIVNIRRFFQLLIIHRLWLGGFLWCLLLALIWWWGDSLAIGDARPLASVAARSMFTLLWLSLTLGLLCWHFYRHGRQMSGSLQEAETESELTHGRAMVRQSAYLHKWLALLGERQGRKGVRALPWYLLLGDRASGKTTLLQRANPANSLDPKLEPELRELAQDQWVSCWAGAKAIMVDPSGELITQPGVTGGEARSQGEVLWHQLLGWFAARQGRPLNGLVLTVDLAWLAQAGAEERKGYVQLMGKRLQEITTLLDCQLPLYVCFTKLDLLRGFDRVYGQLDRATREAVLGVTFTSDVHKGSDWRSELSQFWLQWIDHLNRLLPELMQMQGEVSQREALFSFVRQLAGLKEVVSSMLEEMLAFDLDSSLLFRGVYLTSVYQHGVPFDGFSRAATRRYGLPEPVYPMQRGEAGPYFVRHLFSSCFFPEAHLAGERRQHKQLARRRLVVGAGLFILVALPLLLGWHHYYRLNKAAGERVLAQAHAFTTTAELPTHQALGFSLLPRLGVIREATLTFGNYRERTPLLADLGLYQGDEIGPVVERSYLQLLSLQFLPSLMQGLQQDLQLAPPGSEEKLGVLRVMRMLDDASGRNKALVSQYMAKRWQKAYPGLGREQEALLAHLDYALEHTDWHGARVARDQAAILAFAPFDKPIYEAQRELGRLPMYQRLYQELELKAAELPSGNLSVRDEVGESFDQVFTLADESSGHIPGMLTYPGFTGYFIGQSKVLSELCAADAWVLGERAYLSEADRQEILRQVGERYVTDYVNYWQTLLLDLEVQPLQSPEHALQLLEVITSPDQPLVRVLSMLDANTRRRDPQIAIGSSLQAVASQIDRPFAQSTSVLRPRGELEPLSQEVNQKLIELRNYLAAIVRAPEPGLSALKAVELRVANQHADPVFALQQYARNLPEPLDRWVGQIAEQSASLLLQQATASLNQEWQDKVLTPFNSQLAGRYPFDPHASKDVPLSEMERFFAPGGTLDSFYQTRLRPLLESGLFNGDSGSPLLVELNEQMVQAERIRHTFFTPQGKLEVQFALEPIELTANKRRSVLNLDGQLLDYAHGRRSKVPLVWPNTMRDGAESKVTLVPASGDRSPRSEGAVGPWAMFRLMDKGEVTRLSDATFDIRFPVDNGAMSYRVYTDGALNPFSGGLFSRFKLPALLY